MMYNSHCPSGSSFIASVIVGSQCPGPESSSSKPMMFGWLSARNFVHWLIVLAALIKITPGIVLYVTSFTRMPANSIVPLFWSGPTIISARFESFPGDEASSGPRSSGYFPNFQIPVSRLKTAPEGFFMFTEIVLWKRRWCLTYSVSLPRSTGPCQHDLVSRNRCDIVKVSPGQLIFYH